MNKSILFALMVSSSFAYADSLEHQATVTYETLAHVVYKEGHYPLPFVSASQAVFYVDTPVPSNWTNLLKCFPQEKGDKRERVMRHYVVMDKDKTSLFKEYINMYTKSYNQLEEVIKDLAPCDCESNVHDQQMRSTIRTFLTNCMQAGLSSMQEVYDRLQLIETE